MNPALNVDRSAVPEPGERTPATPSRTRPFYWSVRRELWENRAIYLAPLVTAGVVILGFFINAVRSLRGAGATVSLQLPNQATPIELPYGIAAVLIAIVGVVTAALYCLDALYVDRRDRSVLFWRSLPVSDSTTVLAKASIPLAVVPLAIFGTIVATHGVMLVLNLVLRLAKSAAAPALQSPMPLGQLWVALLYGLAAMALWLAPLYGWLLVVSAWARRAPLLWASLPLIIAGILEKVALNTSHFADFLSYRSFGWFGAAFGGRRPCCIPHPLSAVAAGRFLTTPGLWTGLVMAAIFLAAAARLRRYRGPI